MTVQANGTEAKDVAVHFIKETNKEITPKEMSKTIKQVKALMLKGYTGEQIITTIDYIISDTPTKMYSFGYVTIVIQDLLDKIEAKKEAIQKRKQMDELLQGDIGNEVKENGESTERNRTKTSRFGTQSRFGEKYNINMLEGNREID